MKVSTEQIRQALAAIPGAPAGATTEAAAQSLAKALLAQTPDARAEHLRAFIAAAASRSPVDSTVRPEDVERAKAIADRVARDHGKTLRASVATAFEKLGEVGWSNWSGLVNWLPGRVALAHTAADVQEAVRGAAAAGRRVRVVGAGKSFSGITEGRNGDWLVRLEGLKDIGKVERQADGSGLVSVGPGVRISDLADALEAQGYSMRTMPATKFQTLGGVIATNSHGSAYNEGGFSSLVESLELVDGRGNLIRASRHENPEVFDAVRSGLGLAGIITNVTLRVAEPHHYATKQYMAPLADVVDQRVLDAKNRDHDFFQFFLFPYTDQVFVTEAKRTQEPGQAKSSAFESFAINYIDPLQKALTKTFPSLIPTMWKMTAGMAPQAEFVDEPHRAIAYQTPEYGPTGTQSMEFFFPAEHTAEIVRDLNQVLHQGLDTGKFRTQYYAMVRFQRGDETYLSHAYSKDPDARFGAISVAYNPLASDKGDFFGEIYAAIQKVMARHGRKNAVTCHFGKQQMAYDPAALRAAYPRLDDFKRVRDRLDPDGVFLNPWAEEWLGLTAPAKAT